MLVPPQSEEGSLTGASSSCLLSLLPAALPRCLQLKEDTQFQEFLSVHQKRAQTATWANDALDTEPHKGTSKLANDYLNFDSDSGQESEEEEAGGGRAGKVTPPHAGASCQSGCPCARVTRQGQGANPGGAIIPTAVNSGLD